MSSIRDRVRNSPVARMLFGSAEREVPPTVPVAQAQVDANLLAPMPQTPPSSDEEAADVRELRRDVESLSQQLAAALTMLNTLSVSAAAATEAAQSAAAAAAVAAAAAQNVAQVPAQAPVQAQFAPLNPLFAPAAAEAEQDQSNAVEAAAAAATAAITAAQNAKNTQNAASADKSRLFDYTSQVLLRMLQLEESDPLLYSTATKRFTPNVRALYAWAKQQMPEVFKTFEGNTLQPGFEAQQALRDFRVSMEDWLNPSWYTMTGLVVVGLTADRENAIADQVEELLSIAIGHHEQLDSAIVEMRDTGQFDRAGLMKFDDI